MEPNSAQHSLLSCRSLTQIQFKASLGGLASALFYVHISLKQQDNTTENTIAAAIGLPPQIFPRRPKYGTDDIVLANECLQVCVCGGGGGGGLARQRCLCAEG